VKSDAHIIIRGDVKFMKQVMSTSKKKKHDQERIAVLRLELDYELAVLYEAIQENNEVVKNKSKVKLEKIRDELLKMKAI
jgi:hypothetical protein